MGEVRDALLWGRTTIVLSEDCQASSARPYDKGKVKVKMLEWLELVA
jgi:hypothetical protein